MAGGDWKVGGGRHPPGCPGGDREAASHPDDIRAWAGRRDQAGRQRPGPGQTGALEVAGWAGRATSSTGFPVAAARLPGRAAARAGARSRGGHHPSKVHRDLPRGDPRGVAGQKLPEGRGCCGRPRTRPYTVECPAAQSLEFPKVNNNCTQGASGSMAQPGRAPDS